MVFPVVMYGCESWTVKKAEHRRIDAFELWCWRKLLRVPWTARRSNQSILKEISPGCSLEGMMLKLKLQYFGHLMWRVDFIGKDSDAGRDWGQEEKGMTEDEMAGWHHQLDGRESEWTPGVGDGQGGLACCDSWGHRESDTTEQLNWTEGFPGSSHGKESTHSAGDPGSIPGLERSPGEGKGYTLQCSGLENYMDCIVPGVAKNGTWLSDWTELKHFNTFWF